MERLLLEKLHSPAERGFSFLIGAKGLTDALKLYETQPRYQRLVIDFKKGEDPDDSYSRIPYDKGANLILHIGEALCMHCLQNLEAEKNDREDDRWSGCVPAIRQ